MSQPYRKKLIEVAIPLEAINAASAREKSIRHGHPSTLHLWWARRPLAACRAVLFAQLVDDPSAHPNKFPTEEAINAERERLFEIIEELVKWENSTNEEVLEKARKEIRNSCDGELPSVYDPFSGGGAIPLEAQRLSLPTFGSDLNPIPVMLGKSMIEIPVIFRNFQPVHKGIKNLQFYINADGLAEDVEYYGNILLEAAKKKLGHHYPSVKLSDEYGAGNATVIAWIWSRTVPSPDPAYKNSHVPISSSFVLSTKSKREAIIIPHVDKISAEITYQIKTQCSKDEIEIAKKGTKGARGANFTCLLSGSAITPEYVKQVGQNKQFGQTLIAIIAEGSKGRAYLEPNTAQIRAADVDRPELSLTQKLPNHPQYIGVLGYGFEYFSDLYTDRQLFTLDEFSNQLDSIEKQVLDDAIASGMQLGEPLSSAGSGAKSYSQTIRLYLAFLIDQLANNNSTACSWHSRNSQLRSVFSRQAIQMTWDFAESNPFCASSGSFRNLHERMVKAFKTLGVSGSFAQEKQVDARLVRYQKNCVISTDPPYYDNIPYADLSDFFYMWLRKNAKDVYPDLTQTLSVPKMDELVADRVRHGGPEKAAEFFLNGMQETISNMAKSCSHDIPSTIYYAFKQSEIDQEGTSSTGWATFLEAIIISGFAIVGTWPVRTELATRMRGNSSNALANSVVIVCRLRERDADTLTRSEFIRLLKAELPPALSKLKSANVSPADMPQSAIGPGIGIFSRYGRVMEPDDSSMTVKSALELINVQLDEFLNDFHGEFDPETRFTATWFEQNGYEKGDFGAANSLATARGISVDSVKHAGIVESSAGKVRIFKRDELHSDWDPNSDTHLTIWECCQHLVKEYEENGETAAAMLIKKMGFDKAETVKDLAYYLYDVCSNKRQDAREATSYNGLIAVWSDLTRLASTIHDTDTNRQAAMNF